MTTWDELSKEAPELAASIERSFAGGKHKVMATIRRDGSPRVSGTEVELRDGDVWFGSMPDARKAQDLRRDPRVAIHGPTVDETMAVGDAKLAGRAIEVTDPEVLARYGADLEEQMGKDPGPFHLFKVDLEEAVCTRVEGDWLVIESWHRGRGVRRVRRQ